MTSSSDSWRSPWHPHVERVVRFPSRASLSRGWVSVWSPEVEADDECSNGGGELAPLISLTTALMKGTE